MLERYCYEKLFSWSRNDTFHWEEGSRSTNASEERIKKNSALRLSKVKREKTSFQEREGQ